MARKQLTHTGMLNKPHTHITLPDLVLQEGHVAVQQGVGGGQDSHRLHPGSSLQLTLHRHVSKTGQPEVTAFAEIAEKNNNHNKHIVAIKPPGSYTFILHILKCSGHTYIKSLAIRWEPLAIDLNSTPSKFMS